MDFAVPVDHRVELKECEKKDKYFDPAGKLKKTVEHESDDYINHNWCYWYSNQRMGGDHPNYSIVKIGQNTEKNLGDLGSLAVTQTPVEIQLTLM